MATKKQTWAIFCGTGLDVRNLSLSIDQASMYIDAMKNGKDITPDLIDMGATGTPKVKTDWAPIWEAAVNAGKAAAEAHKPRPMTVTAHANPLDNNSAPVESWYVSEGVCGFAWISVKGNTSFGRWAKKHAGFRTGGGHMKTYLWISQFGQSYERKRVFAQAAVEVLRQHDVDAWSGSRLD